MGDQVYQKRYEVRWNDLDPNVHMENSAYLEYATQTRFSYLSQAGFGPADFQMHRIGPAVFEDVIRYYKELYFLGEFTVDMRLGASSEDGSRFALHNRMHRPDGVLCAEVISQAAWFSVVERKIVPPPDGLKSAMDALVRTEDFRILPTGRGGSPEE
ncbi:MAG: thioesterase family protein [Deltaproteobacteria bacterium]|nr:thioesterase family protein [Deltaproteobacteria bacterium]